MCFTITKLLFFYFFLVKPFFFNFFWGGWGGGGGGGGGGCGQFKKISPPSGSFMGLTYILNVYLKPWFLAHEKKNVLIYSQMRFQLYIIKCIL